MKLTSDAYLVASGHLGVRISHPSDCNAFAFGTGDGTFALVDTGVGINTEAILDNLRSDGIDPANVKHVLLTHIHTDHIGGAATFQQDYGSKIYAPAKEADDLEQIDEVRLGLNVAKRAGFYPQTSKCEPARWMFASKMVSRSSWGISPSVRSRRPVTRVAP